MPKQAKRPGLATDPAAAVAQLETPRMKWKAVAQIALVLVGLWVTAGVAIPFVGYWGLGVVGAVTLAAIGFGVYVARLTARSRAIVDIMKGATDDAGRQRAIEALADDASKDAMKALARAQLIAQTDPAGAARALEAIDIGKAPAVVQDDVRCQLALMHLRNNRVRDARALTDAIRLDRRPDARSKGMYAAVMAEAYARSGSPDEARKLVDTYDPADTEHAEVRALLLRARVFTFFALKKRGLAREAMDALAALEPGMVAALVTTAGQPELVKLARQVLAAGGFAPKLQMKLR
jgi:hypothetical protein